MRGFSINLYNKQWEEKIEEASLFVCLFAEREFRVKL